MIRIIRSPKFLLFLILLVSVLVKDPFHARPFLGHFASYQSVVGMISYNYALHDFHDFFYPTSFKLTNGLPSLEMIYHPFSAFVAALFWKVFGGNLDFWGRFQAIGFSALAVLLAYLCALRQGSRNFALGVAFFTAFSPMSLIYGRTFMNEAVALAGSLASLWMLLSWTDTGKFWKLVLSGVLFSLVMIFRLHYLALLPALLYLAWKGSTGCRLRSVIFFLFFSLALTLLWFLHTYWVTVHYSHLHTSLFAQVEARSFPDPLLFQSSFYKSLLKEVFFRLWGPVPFMLIFFSFQKSLFKNKIWIFLSFISTTALAVLSPQKFLDHPFYFLPLLVPGAFLAASGWERIGVGWGEKRRGLLGTALVLLVLIPNIIFYWKPAFAVLGDGIALREAAQYVREHTAAGDRIIAAHGGSADLLYYTGRYGHNFNITADRSEIPKYFKSRKYSHLSDEEFAIRNKAYQDPVSWLEYLRGEGRVKYLVVVPRSELDKDERFKAYLAATYALVSFPEKEYAVYDLS